MEFTENNELSVTRECAVDANNVSYGSVYYYETDCFEISLDKIKTSWKVVMYTYGNSLYTCLHKVGSSSNDFSLTLTVAQLAPKRFEGRFFKNGEWITLAQSFKGILSIKITLHENPTNSMCLKCEAQYDEQKEELLLSESFNDFKFICADEKTVLANRAILALNSSVFRVMLDAQMLESKTQTTKLKDIDSETMKEVIRFMYTRQIDDIKTHAVKLLYCADKYELRDLRSFCVAGMMRNMSSANVVEYLIAANRYKENDLFRRCLLYIECFSDIIDQKEFQGLDSTLFAFVTYLLDKKEKNMQQKLKLKRIESYSR